MGCGTVMENKIKSYLIFVIINNDANMAEGYLKK